MEYSYQLLWCLQENLTNWQPYTYISKYGNVHVNKANFHLQTTSQAGPNLHRTKIFIAFQDIEDLITVNTCNYEVNQKIKIYRFNLNDRVYLTYDNIISSSISIILGEEPD